MGVWSTGMISSAGSGVTVLGGLAGGEPKSGKAAKEQPLGSKAREPNWSENIAKNFIPGA